MNPQLFLDLDRVIHEKGRLAILSLLAASPDLSFRDMRDLLKMTDGNLMAHLRTLQQAGYVAVTKCYYEKRPLTTYAMTASGKSAFSGHLKLLEKILKENKIS